ncbi:MAG: serine/threonine-protein kinase [Gemmatimonadota bacterium]|nr:serine/threonine-protein kinase [Gemmatimonadota bacterium]
MRAELGDAYVIERELEGGMSCVFVAEDRDLARRVVIKVLHPHLAASVSVERFRREILTVAALQHPHIVPVLRTGMANGLPYFIMPYVDGESLALRLTKGPLTVRETLSVMKDVSRALAFAHERGVVHRDIKPGNILLAGGSAMVTDFGVAKALSSARRTVSSGAGLTTVGTAIGTMLYMAPEQAAGDPEIDGRADVYSLGATAYEMLAGTAPFAGMPARAMLAARMSALPPELSTVREDVPPALDKLIMRCLATDPEDRPATAQELVDILEGRRISSGEFTATPRPWRKRSFAAVAAGLALVTIIGAGVTTSRTHAAGGAAFRAAASVAAAAADEIAVVPFVDLSSDSTDANMAIGLTNAVADNLAKSPKLKVISPTASAALAREIRSGSGLPGKGTPRLLLEGTVQREGSRIRVTARLSNASDGVMQWADVYDRDGRDLFKVTDDIAAAIVASMRHPQA